MSRIESNLRAAVTAFRSGRESIHVSAAPARHLPVRDFGPETSLSRQVKGEFSRARRKARGAYGC